MTRLLAAVIFGATLAVAGVAAADVIPECPDGQMFRSNPVDPEEGHHSGGECVDLEGEGEGGGGGCAVGGPPRSGALPLLLGALALGLVARRRGKNP